MPARACLVALLGVISVWTPVAVAQADGVAASVAQALAEGRFAEAEAEAARAVDADPDDAEAHYLLGRVLYDEANPSRDERRAGQAVARALELQPDNVLYLVARLESLRRESATFIGDMLLMRRREALAQRLLAIDSTNAFAHEELAVQGIRDYYQYRNAISLPGLVFEDGARGDRPGLDRAPTEPVERPSLPEDEYALVYRPPAPLDAGFGDAGGIAAGDRTDVDALLAQGVGRLTFTQRATASYRSAQYHLRTSLRRDPRRRSLYDHVLRLSALSGEWAEARPFVREMITQFDRDPASWLYLGLVAHRQGDAEAAEAAFARAVSRMAEADSASFVDLTRILSPADAERFRADPLTFSRRYWLARDPRYLQIANERRSEHFARLVEADLLFSSERLGRAGRDTERGRMWVRYGPPTRDFVVDGGFQRVLEAWGDRADAYAPSEMEADANRFHVWDYGDLRLVFEDPNRTGEFRLYSPPADLWAVGSARAAVRQSDFVQVAREAVRDRPERYDYAPAGRAVPLPYLVSAFRGDGGRTDLYVAWGVPLAADAPPGADVDLTIRTGAFLVGDDHELRFERRRTIHGLRRTQIASFADTRLWTSVEAMSARPGPHDVSVEFETAGGGTASVQRREVDIPDLSGPGLRMSDILLAYSAVPAEESSAPGRVERNGLAIWAAPWGVFATTDPIVVYAEVYGLELRDGQTDYEVEARLVPRDASRGVGRTLRRLFGARPRGVGTAAEAQGDAPDDWQSLTVDASGQAPGLYTLTVTIRDRVAGREVSRGTDLLLE